MARLLRSYDKFKNKRIWNCCDNITFGEALKLALRHRPAKILSKGQLHTENVEIISKQYLPEGWLSKVAVCQDLIGGDGFHFPHNFPRGVGVKGYDWLDRCEPHWKRELALAAIEILNLFDRH